MTMANWYLNRALTAFRSAVNSAYPHRDKSSDGTIGDAAHQATSSDHNPDRDGSVDAWDMDNNLGTGSKASDDAAVEALIRIFQAHPSSRYWIYNRVIASRSNGWKRERYTGVSAHTEHVHWNTREGYETSTVPWVLEEDDMQLTDKVTLVKEPDVKYSSDTTTVAGVLASTNYYVLQARNQMNAKLAALSAQVAAQTKVIETLADTLRAGGGSVDTVAILDGVRDIVADLAEGGAAQVRAEQS